MHFKRLELSGFKSFAEPTVIHFEPGVTAIVGPNGCGKSNIADSIRWVLGEQSAKSLRGSSMADVIFNGSAVKEPLGLAEVSLTLSNEKREFNIDYDEVTITRRLYRSGDSEYLINKNTVRLKDIHEMLMGTGVGTDTYSIIEQGKMDVILNSKPEDRRVIFEEAAGITKFKAKKTEALRKLEQTEANLLRVNDIILEVKRQIGSIERQARRAETYKGLYEELKRAELSQAMRQFLTFDKDRLERQEQLGQLKQRESECALGAREVETAFESQRRTLIEIEQTVGAHQSRDAELSGLIKVSQERVLLNHERMGEIEARRQQIESEIEGARTRIAQLDGGFAQLDQAFAQAAQIEAEGQAFLASVESAFEDIDRTVRDAEARDNDSRAALFDLAKERARVQTDAARLSAGRQSLEARVRRLRDRQAQLGAQAASVAGELDAQIAELAAQEARLQQATTEKEKAEQELGHYGERLASNERQAHEMAAQAGSLRSKIQFLKDLKDRYEGFMTGVQALMRGGGDGAAHSHGLVGLLAERVRARAGDELAVEAALAPFSQAVLFSNAVSLLEAVRFLKNTKKGRALLLNLEGVSRNGHLIERPSRGVPVLASLESDEATTRLLERLCANTYVVDEPQEAHDLARNYPTLTFVTRSGERFEGEMVLAGESSSETEHLVIGRQSRLEALERELQQLDGDLLTRHNDVEQLRGSRSQLKEQLERCLRDLPSLQMGLADARAGLRHSQEKRTRLEDELGVLATEIEELLHEDRALTDRSAELDRQLAQLTQREAELEAARAEAEAVVRARSAEREALLVKLTETRSRQAQKAEARQKAEHERQWLEESKKTEQARIEQLGAQLQDGVSRREALLSENEKLKAEIGEGEQQRLALVGEMDGSRRAREGVLEQLTQLENERAQRTAFLDQAREQAHQYELQTTQLLHEMDRLKDRIFNAYQVDLIAQMEIQRSNAEAAAWFDGETAADEQAETARIAEMREKLSKMGPVNLAAVEEHDEMKQRYEFLSKQQADLLQAKDDLHKAILKMNRQTREMFTATFVEIQKSFTEYFKLLFGGGTAELVLLDENDVLESGIEIVARPPGKKLQSITLLSGGEKALTAVALLFSIFKVKPSPFCVLDEIDAPLDESNVDRFCGVLREFITGSQFILVTHNKRTMSLADAMYGITMAQTGISRVVSVKFGEPSHNRRSSDRREVVV